MMKKCCAVLVLLSSSILCYSSPPVASPSDQTRNAILEWFEKAAKVEEAAGVKGVGTKEYFDSLKKNWTQTLADPPTTFTAPLSHLHAMLQFFFAGRVEYKPDGVLWTMSGYPGLNMFGPGVEGAEYRQQAYMYRLAWVNEYTRVNLNQLSKLDKNWDNLTRLEAILDEFSTGVFDKYLNGADIETILMAVYVLQSSEAFRSGMQTDLDSNVNAFKLAVLDSSRQFVASEWRRRPELFRPEMALLSTWIVRELMQLKEQVPTLSPTEAYELFSFASQQFDVKTAGKESSDSRAGKPECLWMLLQSTQNAAPARDQSSAGRRELLRAWISFLEDYCTRTNDSSLLTPVAEQLNAIKTILVEAGK